MSLYHASSTAEARLAAVVYMHTWKLHVPLILNDMETRRETSACLPTSST